MAVGRQRCADELERMAVPAHRAIVSTNVVLRLDGAPRSGQPEPTDPGASIYWQDGGRQQYIAVDRYDRVADNLAAIAATLEAMRAIERHGGAEILDRAFTGFVALLAPEQPLQVLGVAHDASDAEVDRAYRRLASEHHPDRGGDAGEMARINAARDAMESRA